MNPGNQYSSNSYITRLDIERLLVKTAKEGHREVSAETVDEAFEILGPVLDGSVFRETEGCINYGPSLIKGVIEVNFGAFLAHDGQSQDLVRIFADIIVEDSQGIVKK